MALKSQVFCTAFKLSFETEVQSIKSEVVINLQVQQHPPMRMKETPPPLRRSCFRAKYSRCSCTPLLSVPLFARLPTNRVVFDRDGDKATQIGPLNFSNPDRDRIINPQSINFSPFRSRALLIYDDDRRARRLTERATFERVFLILFFGRFSFFSWSYFEMSHNGNASITKKAFPNQRC